MCGNLRIKVFRHPVRWNVLPVRGAVPSLSAYATEKYRSLVEAYSERLRNDADSAAAIAIGAAALAVSASRR